MVEKIQSARQQVGRPRSESSKMAILNATVDLLEENGYSVLSIEAIAARAGVGKTTIYRWWPNKELLLLDVFLMVTETQVQFEDNVSIRQNFYQLLISLAKVFNSIIGRTMISIIAQSEPVSEIAGKFNSSFLKPRRRDAKRILEYAIAQGEIRDTIDLDVALDMLFGPIYFRILLNKENLDVEFNKTLVDHVLEGIKHH